MDTLGKLCLAMSRAELTQGLGRANLRVVSERWRSARHRLLGEAGECDEARQAVDGMTKMSTSRYYPPSAIALGYIGLGEWDDAFVWLDQAVEQRDPIVMPIKSFPFLDPVRDDHRYQQLLQKMNLAIADASPS